MNCPHCRSTAVSGRKRGTTLDYKTLACRTCKRRFNERTGSPFNDLQCTTDIVLLAVLWRLRYKLGVRDVAELLLQRGFEVSHETIRAWEFRFAPMVSQRLRARRRGKAGRSWYLEKPTSKSAASGATCPALSTEPATSWTPCWVSTVTENQRGASCAASSMVKATSRYV